MPGWRVRLVAGAAVIGAAVISARGAQADELFTCREIVTGTAMRMHPEAMERCVRDTVVKVTGRPSLRDDRRADAIVAEADPLVEDVVYLDRMSDIPHHDEQGTRERPYDLVVHFDPDGFARALAAQGLAVWRDRPALLVDVMVHARRGQYRLDADSDDGERQREAALAAGERFGMRLVLPTQAQAAAETWPSVRGGAVRLQGQIAWSDADFGWTANWSLGEARWEVRGVSFDEAYRVGVGGAAERLAGR